MLKPATHFFKLLLCLLLVVVTCPPTRLQILFEKSPRGAAAAIGRGRVNLPRRRRIRRGGDQPPPPPHSSGGGVTNPRRRRIRRRGNPPLPPLLLPGVGDPTSPLATAADASLDVSVKQEACPLNLAPTSSTTASLVMGDALAIALLEKRGFTAEDFAFSHPGGALGKRLLLKVEDVMHTGTALPRVSLGTITQGRVLMRGPLFVLFCLCVW